MRLILGPLFILLFFGTSISCASQLVDNDFDPKVANPAFEKGQGPVVSVDMAHENFHTCPGRYAPFCNLLTKDGYVVVNGKKKFDADSLSKIDLLVISNALNKINVDPKQNWATPILSAFTADEIAAVKTWVTQGGSLLLIADHMPFPGAASEMGLAFGVNWGNNYAFAANTQIVEAAKQNSLAVITGPDANLMKFDLFGPNPTGVRAFPHPVFRGRSGAENVPYVTSFTGSAYSLTPGSNVVPIMELGKDTLLLYPTESQKQDLATPRGAGMGLFQGGMLSHGKGRVALMGEASMFTAQIADYISPGFQMGMNNTENAPYDVQFVLNVAHWLTKVY